MPGSNQVFGKSSEDTPDFLINTLYLKYASNTEKNHLFWTILFFTGLNNENISAGIFVSFLQT